MPRTTTPRATAPRTRRGRRLVRCDDSHNQQETPIPITTNEQDQITLAANALKRVLPGSEAPPPENRFINSFFSTSPGNGSSYLAPPGMYRAIPLIISPLFYGLPHLLGWYELFPTSLERQIWRISTCVVMGSGLFVISIRALDALSPDAGVALASIALAIVYTVASGFLLGESLRQLLFLDPAAYQLASWSNYWPHFS